MFEFKDMDYITDGEIALRIDEKLPENPEKKYVPAYRYKITLNDSVEPIGEIDIRIGDNEGIFYGGHIGYMIEEDYRGNAYASKACRLIGKVAMAHGMEKVTITCNPDNYPSRRTCEKLGAELIEIVDLPEDNEMYQAGEKQKCRYLWTIE
ncbi:GNAT family N-acetyltransferase [Oceanirhabdus sp. W0125-5]|uniref:GNAT family N-acetyltransferase n=1 Tax=Oceanirhabdus sp. W0125-5 TaxID=2999116 RepID=UPI0022F3333B|nr:GNAT family N-acetyltransferase [Oceanirhabdus sp. W0125-5]WBW96966.1 GNAT family N-acetyltransferase [Oceanirhabdus sp. W0125-5]